MRRAVVPLALGLTLVGAIPAAFGGWAVISVQDVPAYLEAGTPTTLTFAIRQHGREPMTGRSPVVTLARPEAGWFAKKARFKASATNRPGVYTATVTAEDTGSVAITIDADFRGVRSTLLPIGVVTAGQAPPAPAAHVRGRHLFVAKGCATCHVKADDDLGDRDVVRVGPDLTSRTYDPEWLARKLDDPAQFRAGSNGDFGMPDLGLTEPEIAALVAYLNRGTTSAARR